MYDNVTEYGKWQSMSPDEAQSFIERCGLTGEKNPKPTEDDADKVNARKKSPAYFQELYPDFTPEACRVLSDQATQYDIIVCQRAKDREGDLAPLVRGNRT